MATEQQFLRSVLRDDADAVAFIDDLFRAFHVWDDLIDGDPATPDQINEAFTAVLIRVPRNPFFQRHAQELQPLIEAAVIDWKAANEFECGSAHCRHLAFVLRDHVAQIVIRSAWCVGGQAWAEQVAPAIWRMNCDDTLDDYLAELEART